MAHVGAIVSEVPETIAVVYVLLPWASTMSSSTWRLSLLRLPGISMNDLLRSVPAVALTLTLVACGEQGGSGAYAVDLTLGTVSSGQTEFFGFQVVKLGIPCVLDIDAGPNPVTVGACTYFPPPLVADPGPGCGTPNTAANAGTIKLVDTTKGTTLGSWTSQADSMSFTNSPWVAGDTVTVTASGAEVPSFSISAPVLSAPSITLPVFFSANQNLALSWTPDPNAQTMVVSISETSRGDSITCTPPDAAGTLVIDASLFAKFVESSGPFAIAVYREYAATVSDGPAQVKFTSYGSMDTNSIAFE